MALVNAALDECEMTCYICSTYCNSSMYRRNGAWRRVLCEPHRLRSHAPLRE